MSEIWYHRRESNPYLRLRRSPFYPLNYGGEPRFYLLNKRIVSSSPLSVSGNMRWLMSCCTTLML